MVTLNFFVNETKVQDSECLGVHVARRGLKTDMRFAVLHCIPQRRVNFSPQARQPAAARPPPGPLRSFLSLRVCGRGARVALL